MTGNGFSGLYSQDTFFFYKETKCVKNTLILMPASQCQWRNQIQGILRTGIYGEFPGTCQVSQYVSYDIE
jgi:hypothetical protein